MVKQIIPALCVHKGAVHCDKGFGTQRPAQIEMTRYMFLAGTWLTKYKNRLVCCCKRGDGGVQLAECPVDAVETVLEKVLAFAFVKRPQP